MTPKKSDIGNYYIGIKLTDFFGASTSYKFVVNVKPPRSKKDEHEYTTEIKANLRI